MFFVYSRILFVFMFSFIRYVLVGMAQVKDAASGVRADLLKRLLPYFTSGPESRSSSVVVMKR